MSSTLIVFLYTDVLLTDSVPTDVLLTVCLYTDVLLTDSVPTDVLLTDSVPTDVLLTVCLYTDVLLTDSVPTDVLFTVCLYTDVLLTDGVPTDVGPAGGGAALGGADAVVVAGALSVAAQTVIGSAHRTLAGLEPDNVGLRGPAGSACGQTSLSSATWSSRLRCRHCHRYLGPHSVCVWLCIMY